MTAVHVLMRYDDNEGPDPIAVYSTPERAQAGMAEAVRDNDWTGVEFEVIPFTLDEDFDFHPGFSDPESDDLWNSTTERIVRDE